MNKKDYINQKSHMEWSREWFYKEWVHKIHNQELAKSITMVLISQPTNTSNAENELIDLIHDKSYLANNNFELRYKANQSWPNYISATEKRSNKVKQRTMTEQEYQKIMKEIDENNSILPISNERSYSYGHWGGDVILSETTGKMYCTDSADLNELIRDYNWNQYYTSRSGASGAWNIIAGKKTLIYLPTVRKDVAHPFWEIPQSDLNGLRIFAWSDRGVVDKNYPITIIGKDSDEYDFTFLDPTKPLEVISTIKSQGEGISDLPLFEENFWSYFDKNWDSQELIITYHSKNKISKKIITDIVKNTDMCVKYRPDFQETWSEFDRVVWIKKVWDLYLGKWKFWLARQNFWEKNPRLEQINHLVDYSLWDKWLIEKEYYWEYDWVKINWRTIIDENIAIRSKWKSTIILHEWELGDIDAKFISMYSGGKIWWQWWIVIEDNEWNVLNHTVYWWWKFTSQLVMNIEHASINEIKEFIKHGLKDIKEKLLYKYNR